MLSLIRHKEKKTSLLERFGVYYLNIFGQRELTHHIFDFTDEEIKQKVNRISTRGLSCLQLPVLCWCGRLFM